jgi:hypothetical protein
MGDVPFSINEGEVAGGDGEFVLFEQSRKLFFLNSIEPAWPECVDAG